MSLIDSVSISEVMEISSHQGIGDFLRMARSDWNVRDEKPIGVGWRKSRKLEGIETVYLNDC